MILFYAEKHIFQKGYPSPNKGGSRGEVTING